MRKWSAVLSGETGCTAIIRAVKKELGLLIDDSMVERVETFHLLDTEISNLPYLRELYVIEVENMDSARGDVETKWVSSEKLFEMIQNNVLDTGINTFMQKSMEPI